MPHRSAVGLALAGLALTCLPALADAPVTDGLICSFSTVVDPTAEEGTQTGQLEGGPVLFTVAPDGTIPQQGTLVCRVQVVNAFTSDHNGTGPSVSGHTNAAGVATAGPQAITINQTGTENVFLCSEFVDDASGITYYWDDDLSEWSTLSTVHCGLSIGGDDGGNPSEDPINRIPCPMFSLLPSPLAELAQALWGDCDEAGPPSTIGIQSIPGTNTALLVTPPGWSCDMSTGSIVGPSGEVTCTEPLEQTSLENAHLANTRTRCLSVKASAHLTPDGSSTVTYTSKCGTLAATATAGPTSVLAEAEQSGSSNRPIVCTWNVTGAPVTWGGSCETNTG